jgi:hypothetical protein
MRRDVAPGVHLESVPEPRPQQNAWRKVFSFPVALAALLIALAVLTVRPRFSDPDMWWHMKTGEIVWSTHAVPQVDVFSFTTNGHRWTPQEWLSQLTIFAAYHAGGYPGLMLWFCIAASVIVAGAYVLCAMYSGNAKVAFLGGLGTWLFSTVGLAIRPQMLGYSLLICELLILHLGRSRNPRWFLALPPLFGLWVNCHGSFFFGLMVCAAVLFCSFIDLHVGLLVSQRWAKKPRHMLALAFGLSIGALFINPAGWHAVVYPLDVLANQQVQMHSVSEWLPPRFDNLRGLALLGVAGSIVLIPLLRRAELRLDELLVAAFAFGLAVQHERMLFVFGIIAAPIACRLLASAWDQYEPAKDLPLANAVLVALAIGAAVWAFPDTHQLQVQVDANNPVKAVRFINRSGLGGRMLNEYVYGGYLIWAAPQHKVFVDGRGDVFEWTGVLADYGKLMTVQEDPSVVLDKYHIDFCLFARGEPITHVLPLLPGWKMIYSDDRSLIFQRSATPLPKG